MKSGTSSYRASEDHPRHTKNWTGLTQSPGYSSTLAFCLPVFSAVFVALITGSVWEDGLITLRQAINWVDGRGLTYNPDELVHGFTSPLNVLLLSLFYKLFGAQDPLHAIYAFRTTSILFLGLTGLLIVRVFRLNGEKSTVWPLLAIAFFSLDYKIMLFSINGQEAAFTVFFIALGLVAILTPGKRARLIFLTLAITGLQWNRPEGFIYALGLLAGGFACAASGRRWAKVGEYFWAVLGAIVLYLPWIVFTTLYYGTPIPNTIRAKASAGALDLFLEKLPLSLWHVSSNVLAPPYFVGVSGAPLIFTVILGSFSLCCLLALFVFPFSRLKNPLGILCSTCALFSFVYLCFVAATSGNYPWPWPFPWYYPPLSFCLVLGLAVGLSFFAKSWGHYFGQRLFWRCTIFFSVVLTVFYLRGSFLTRNLQEGVELGVRKQVGLWLRDHVQPGETVYCECIGYIGFYSQAIVLDYPGLTSRKTAEIKRAGALDFFGLLNALQPNWLALRQNEAATASKMGLLKNYEPVQNFSVPEPLAKRDGLGPNNVDGRFLVFKRIKAL